jgi:hypothetical protein
VEGLAQNIFGDTRSGSLAGPLGLLIIVLLAIGTVLLIRNMNKRLKRLPERFPDQPSDPPSAAHSDEDQPEKPVGPDPADR